MESNVAVILLAYSMNLVKHHTNATELFGCRKNIAMLLCRLINKCCFWEKKGSVQFYVPIFRLPLSAHFFFSFCFVSCFVFHFCNLLFHASSFLRLIHQRIFAIRVCAFSWISSSVGFMNICIASKLKMCLRDPYLKTTFSAHWLVLVSMYGAFHYTHTLTNTTKIAFNSAKRIAYKALLKFWCLTVGSSSTQCEARSVQMNCWLCCGCAFGSVIQSEFYCWFKKFALLFACVHWCQIFESKQVCRSHTFEVPNYVLQKHHTVTIIGDCKNELKCYSNNKMELIPKKSLWRVVSVGRNWNLNCENW